MNLSTVYLHRFTADLEKSIVSVERIKEYQQTPAEAPFSIPHQAHSISTYYCSIYT